MQNQLAKFKQLQESSTEFVDKLNYVNSVGEEFILKSENDSATRNFKTELEDLNHRWPNVIATLEERQQKLIKGYYC